MKLYYLFLIILWSLNVKANIKGKNFDPTKDIDFPELYFLGHNFIQFPNSLGIDSIGFNNKLWEATNKNNALFCININRHPLMHKIRFQDTVDIILYGMNYTWKYKVKINPFAELLISAKSFKKRSVFENNSSIDFTDTIFYHAYWDYPSHVKGYMRFRGVFSVDIISKNKTIQSVMGWYDAGDRTKPIYLSRYAEYGQVQLKVNMVKLPYRGNILNLEKEFKLSDKSTLTLKLRQ